MLVEQVKELSPTDQLFYLMRERHQIYLKKRAGLPKPWTDDEILQNWFFTNPYRENDKVTRWFRDHIRAPLRNDPRVLFATICFRWFTWPQTATVLRGQDDRMLGDDLLLAWDLEEALCRLERMKAEKEKIFTAAFNISNSGSSKNKINRVCEDYIQPAWELCGPGGRIRQLMERGASDYSLSMKEAHELLSAVPGFGGSGFMAYEVVCDLRYTFYLDHADDKFQWSNPGPGARRGLNRILGRSIGHPLSNEEWQEQSRALLKLAQKRLTRMPLLEMREIEHSLCELSKYCSALYGDGHLKRRYNGV